METQLDAFTKAYLTAALWSESDDNDIPLDDNYSIADFDEHALNTAIVECQAFQAQCHQLLNGIPEEQAGHDFWLTRNGHGAGFWDRGLGEIGDKLTEACKSFGEANIYVTDSNTIGLFASIQCCLSPR